MWIDETFPGMAYVDWEITSAPNDDYNCIAYAVGEKTRWWSHAGNYRWPNARRSPSIDSLIEMLVGQDFELCDWREENTGFDKVALYAKDGNWKHAAVQLPDGAWSSKLGAYEDIQHATPESLAGEFYGNVHCFMRRAQK